MFVFKMYVNIYGKQLIMFCSYTRELLTCFQTITGTSCDEEAAHYIYQYFVHLYAPTLDAIGCDLKGKHSPKTPPAYLPSHYITMT